MSEIELSGAGWTRASRSEGNGQGVEVARVAGGVVAPRDRKDQAAGPVMVLPEGQGDGFVGGLVSPD